VNSSLKKQVSVMVRCRKRNQSLVAKQMHEGRGGRKNQVRFVGRFDLTFVELRPIDASKEWVVLYVLCAAHPTAEPLGRIPIYIRQPVSGGNTPRGLTIVPF